MISRLREDISCVFERDPAARSTWEVLTCYPGLHALVLHRVTHWLWGARLRWLARFLAHLTGNGNRDSSGGHHRSPRVHRSWHGRGHRRDRRNQ